MTGVWIIGGLCFGGALGYLFFVLRYGNRHLVDEMRRNLTMYKNECDLLKGEHDELLQQNLLLKQKVTELFEKNDDLSRVVSELSRYYYLMKSASEKLDELKKIIQLPAEQVEEKVKKLGGLHHHLHPEDSLTKKR